MWGEVPSKFWDWDSLRDMITKNGVRNSLLVAPMPTASTSQILGNNECFEPYTSNIYSRRVIRYVSSISQTIVSSFINALSCLLTSACLFLSGEFVVVNKHLLHDLTEMGLWSPTIKNKIIYENGSVQKIPEIPNELKLIYKYGTDFIFKQFKCGDDAFLLTFNLYCSELFGRSSKGI